MVSSIPAVVAVLVAVLLSSAEVSSSTTREVAERLSQTLSILRDIHARTLEYRIQMQRMDALMREVSLAGCRDDNMLPHSVQNIRKSLDNIAIKLGHVESNVVSIQSAVQRQRTPTVRSAPQVTHHGDGDVSENRRMLLDLQHSLRRIEQNMQGMRDRGVIPSTQVISLDQLKAVVKGSLNELERNIDAKFRELIEAQQTLIQDLLRAFGNRVEVHHGSYRTPTTVISGDSIRNMLQEAFNTGIDVYSQKVGHIVEQKLHAFTPTVQQVCSASTYSPPALPAPAKQQTRPDRTQTRHGERPQEVRRYSTAGVDIVGPPDSSEKIEVGKRLSKNTLEMMYRHHKPQHCSDIQKLGYTKSGVYEVFVETYGEPMPVYCDLDTAGGGWTVLQRRNYLKRPYVNFDRPWSDYKDGFGDLNGEFYLGNRYIHIFTSAEPVLLRLEMVDANNHRGFAEYEGFRVLDEYHKYLLYVGSYVDGNVKDELTSHNGSYFSTPDEDNDRHPGRNCAETFFGGWWYDNCFRVNFNGLHVYPFDSKAIQGIYWGFRFPGGQRLRSSEMKIRPQHYRRSSG